MFAGKAKADENADVLGSIINKQKKKKRAVAISFSLKLIQKIHTRRNN